MDGVQAQLFIVLLLIAACLHKPADGSLLFQQDLLFQLCMEDVYVQLQHDPVYF